MTTFTYRFGAAAALSPDSVRLIKTGDTWANGEAMTFNNTLKCYELDIDPTSGALFGGTGFDTDVTYYARHNDATDLYDALMIGDGVTKDELDTHIADTTTHGVAGAIVGISDAQTLTNKVIDGDDNTISDISFASMKAGTAAPSHYVKPGADDTALHLDTSSATILTATAGNVAKSADRSLKLVCDELKIANRSAAAIKITGLAAATANGDAVRYDEFHALDLRVAALEDTDAFSGSPVCSVSCSNFTGRIGRRLGANRETFVDIAFNMDGATNEAAIKRYEIFWTTGSFGRTIAVGSISAEDLAYLRTTAGIACEKLYRGEGNRITIAALQQKIAVQVVAFDWTTGQYASAQTSFLPIDTVAVGGLVEDNNTIWIEQEATIYRPEKWASAATAGSTAADWLEWLESSTTPVVKLRSSFEFETGMIYLHINLLGKTTAGAGNFCRVTFTITERVTGTVMSTGGIDFTGTSYEEKHLDIDIANISLVAGTMYNIAMSMAAGGSYNVNVKENVIIKAVKRCTTSL